MAFRLSLKTRFTLTTSLLVLAVVALTASVYIRSLTRQTILETNQRTRLLSQQIFRQAQQALADAAQQGDAPASDSPADLREYVRKALDESSGLTAQVDAAVADWPSIYDVSITETDGTVLISSDPSQPGQKILPRAPFDLLVSSGFLDQLRVLGSTPRVYEVRFPFNLGNQPFGDIRIGVSTALLKAPIEADLRGALWIGLSAVLLSTVAAAVISHIALRPLARISAQLDRIARGEADVEPVEGPDEFGQVSSKISKIGQELRGVREIFSTLRENLNQIMSGLEDGLLLFTRDGRVVMASPAAGKFLGVQPESLLGRRASEIFPAGHALREVLTFDGEQLAPLAGAEVHFPAGAPPAQKQRIGVSVQVITEGGTRMGALMTLRDLESLERIGSQLQVSERLAALGRVTAGVAHEVKNPLNSMRLWLENLREGLAPDQELAQQAVKILDSEIDRLDRVVKTFLNFNRPVELHLEETRLDELLQEILTIAQPQIQQGHIEARLESQDSLPRVRVDRQLFKQAILNLVLNACEVMAPQGGGKLTLQIARRNGNAEVRVGDSGPGIPGELRPKIFQLYFTTRPGGSGIGLATTFRIVQFHNGSIDFESEVGRGTTFRIELPLAH